MKYIDMERKPNRKDRRNSGRVITKIYHPEDHPYEFVYWDDWKDHRDGLRNPIDKTQLRNPNCYWSDQYDIEKYNAKNKKMLKRREAMKNAHKDRNSK